MRRLLLSSLILFSSCSQLEMGRSYLTEMEYNDSPFYSPAEDFPIMAGDSGDMGRTLSDYGPATPLSKEEQYAKQSTIALEEELRHLEAQQNEQSHEFYEGHKHKLSTVSERIYFLKLPARERSDYLASRGLLESQKAAPGVDRRPASLFGKSSSYLDLGMNKDEVLNSWGKPTRVEVAGNPLYENERWLYSVHGTSKYIYFESGTVQGWE